MAEFDAERPVQATTDGCRRTPREAPRGTIGGHGQAGTTPDLAADRSNKVATSACERITLARATTLWILVPAATPRDGPVRVTHLASHDGT